MEEAWNSLPDNQRKVISLRFGLTDGQLHSLQDVAMECSLSRQRIQQIESSVKKALRRSMNSKKIYDLRDNQELKLSSEEKERIDSLTKRLYTSNITCVPDEEYSKEPDDISSSELIEIVRELQKVREDYEKRISDEQILEDERDRAAAVAAEQRTELEILRAVEEQGVSHT